MSPFHQTSAAGDQQDLDVASAAVAIPLDALAAETLRFNDAGDFTYPDRTQYPHQWNWDSAFAAIGWAHIDPTRGYRELQTLLSAQDTRALVPHIIYDRVALTASYRPTASDWGPITCPNGRSISGITQPPVAGIALRYLFERDGDNDCVRELITRIAGWHQFLLTDRDPLGMGEPTLIHPWESGRDNAAEWDGPLARVHVESKKVERTDLYHGKGEERPTNTDYAHYMALVEAGKASRWNQESLARVGSFRVLDPGFSSILAAACADLAEVATAIGSVDIAQTSRAQAEQLKLALAGRADSDGIVWPHDLVTGIDLKEVSAGVALQTLVPGVSRKLAARIAEIALSGRLDSPIGVRSLAVDSHMLEPLRYWRGPVWSNITWL
ncbi:MAG: hypothetical protein JHC87_03515, partial [Thermoleophilaceae bacterium]|nr:hypothetical protein [Thermoleophilaceae bacterium]